MTIAPPSIRRWAHRLKTRARRAAVARGAGRLATVCLAAGLLSAIGCARPSGPSVVLIVIDTLRADHLGTYGAGSGRTPVLDRLAASGVVFERCYAQYPLTLPSISTLLASQWPHVHRVRENYDERLSGEATTLAEVFAGEGYATGGFVSALPLRAETGCAQGFDLYDDDFSERYVFHQPRMKPLEERWTGSERRGDLTVERAVAWMREQRSPYFLFVHLFDPHSPYDAPPEHASAQPTPYAGEVAYADALVGRLLGALDEHDDRAPIVAVVSDHGEGLGEHGEWAHGIFLYDATLHVPWILAGVDSVEASRVSEDVRLLDVAPTLLDLAGLEVPETWAGASCVPLLRGEHPPPREIYAENYFTRSEYGWSELRAWVAPEWKWIRAPRPELYDRSADPGERTNLAPRAPGRGEALDAALEAFLAESRARAERLAVDGLVESIEPSARVLDWLRSLGYLSGDDVSRSTDRSLPDPKDRIDEWNARNDAHTHAGRGFALLDAGQPAVALQAFRAAVEYFPSTEALTGLGLAQLELGAVAEAESSLARAVAGAPRDVPALMGYARVLDAGDRLAAADSILTRVVLIDTTTVEAIEMRARVRDRRGHDAAALADYERLVSIAPGDARARQRAADLHTAAGRWDDARDHLRALVELRPWDPVALWQLGVAEARCGSPGGARDALERAREHAGTGAVRDSIDAALASLGR